MLFRTVIYIAFVATTSGALAFVPALPPAPAATGIEIRTFQFAPDTVRVAAGAKVEWANLDDIEHTVTAGSPEKRDPRFHGVIAGRGKRYIATLTEPGAYPYFCDRHQFMRGVIIVNR